MKNRGSPSAKHVLAKFRRSYLPHSLRNPAFQAPASCNSERPCTAPTSLRRNLHSTSPHLHLRVVLPAPTQHHPPQVTLYHPFTYSPQVTRYCRVRTRNNHEDQAERGVYRRCSSKRRHCAKRVVWVSLVLEQSTALASSISPPMPSHSGSMDLASGIWLLAGVGRTAYKRTRLYSCRPWHTPACRISIQAAIKHTTQHTPPWPAFQMHLHRS